MAWVEICNFSYTYPGEDTPVLNDVNFSFEKGAFAVITGKSGCGKSTLGKALAGFLFQEEVSKYSGTICVNNTDMTRVPLYESSHRVAYVQQNPEDQFCTLTVLDEIAFGLENQGIAPDEINRRINDALSTVKGLPLKDCELATLSGGEKQKVAIASMLALSPDVLILDEPTSNLDPIATQNIFETLNHMRKNQALTVIIIEHKLSQLQSINPDLYLLDAGKIMPIQQFPAFFPAKTKKIVLPINTKNGTKYENQPSIKLSQVDVKLGEHLILQNIDLNIEPGEFIALSGPNGSGKTTLLLTLMGFHALEAGTMSIFDHESPNVKTSALVTNVGFIFQNPDHQLFAQSVWDEATFAARNLKTLTPSLASTAHNWLRIMGLADRIDDHPHRLSYGEKRRLNLIAVMLHNPRLLLIDEFLIGQDMETAHMWMAALKDYTKFGNSILLVNHHANLTQDYCDRLVFLDEGKIVVDDLTQTAFSILANTGYSSFLPLSKGATSDA